MVPRRVRRDDTSPPGRSDEPRRRRRQARIHVPSRSQRPGRRLDQPADARRPLLRSAHHAPETFGHLSEHIARFIGTGRFLLYMTLVIIGWVVWNTVAPRPWRFDPYPFIFLTLALSLQASYAAPLILLAQNRQADRDRVQYEQDRARGERTVAETEYITREIADLRLGLGEVATRDFVRSELQRLLEELSDGETRTGRSDGRRAGT